MRLFKQGYLADTFPGPYGDEIKGIAKASKIPLGMPYIVYPITNHRNVFYSQISST